jgi:hypothetical protein
VKTPVLLAARKVQREKYQKPLAQHGEDEMSTLCRFLAGLMCFAGLTASAGAQGYPAQGYPTRPVRLIVGFAAGGSTDYVARSVADRMRPLLSQPMVVENKPGANGRDRGRLRRQIAVRRIHALLLDRRGDHDQSQHPQRPALQCDQGFRTGRAHCSHSRRAGGESLAQSRRASRIDRN